MHLDRIENAVTHAGPDVFSKLLGCVVTIMLAQLANAIPLRIEAEHARIQTVGSDQSGIWTIPANGEIGDYVQFEQDGRFHFAVRAFGKPAAGVWPKICFVVDDRFIAELFVSTDSAADYRFTHDIDAGLHKIAIAYVNNARVGAEDRDLFVDYIEIAPDRGSVVRGDKDTWEQNWRRQSALRDAQALEDARAEIPRVRMRDITLHIVDALGRPVSNAAVRIEQVEHDFLFGCNIFMLDQFKTPRENRRYKRRFEELFNYATTGFYWSSYESERGKPQYESTDKVLRWCDARGIRVKGHPLLWDHEAGQPAWAAGQPSPELQEKRVREIVAKYKGRIEFWEVVNEAAHKQGIRIDSPYRWARESDPKAHLIVNEYEVMANGYLTFFELLSQALHDGVPFDGIGIQAHEPATMWFPPHKVKEYLDKYAILGKAIHITEFSPSSNGKSISHSPVQGMWDEAAQADFAAQFYTVCFSHPAVAAITWWDLSDTASWIPGAGLLGTDLTPKPAYIALKKLIWTDWCTRITEKTRLDGSISMKGFYGSYAVRASVNGKSVGGRFQILRDADPVVRVALK
jgi:endo-1,4-beta-xylanase